MHIIHVEHQLWTILSQLLFICYQNDIFFKKKEELPVIVS